jgi:uncharacterized protein YmfQ (DUF2313 family)
MGIKVQAPEQYEASLQRLFPRGPYWDQQFADPESDCSIFCKAKMDNFIRFRTRMINLQAESMVESAQETLEEWERVINGTVTLGLKPEERRASILAQRTASINFSSINEIGKLFGFDVTDIAFPFRSAFFGFSRFALDGIASPASFSVIYVHVTISVTMALKIFTNHYRRSAFGFAHFGIDRMVIPSARSAVTIYLDLEGEIGREFFENSLMKRLLANYTVFFIFGGF